MKKSILCLIILFGTLFSSCSSTKNVSQKELYNTTWELDFITGSRIEFEGLYPEKKPQITFVEKTNTAQGTNSCNGYSAKYTLDGNKISFSEPGPTTMMYCEGDGDIAFLKMMQKVESFSFDADKKLNLIAHGIPVMRFKKVTPE